MSDAEADDGALDEGQRSLVVEPGRSFGEPGVQPVTPRAPVAGVITGCYGGNTMIRTRISLEERAYREAKLEARQQGISLAEFLRRAVRVSLPPRAQTGRIWMRYAGGGIRRFERGSKRRPGRRRSAPPVTPGPATVTLDNVAS